VNAAVWRTCRCLTLGDRGLTADKTSKAAEQGGAPGADKALAGDAQVAAALRQAYEEAVREDVPAEFLDLLDKLS